MSKLLPFLVAGVGASSVSVGGVFMLKKTGGNGTSKGQQDNTQSETKLSADLGFTDLASFKTNKGGECAKKYLGDFEYDVSKASTPTPELTIDNNYFSGSEQVQSCLVINWNKTKSSEAGKTKGTGTFRWLGTFVRGTKGIVVFSAIKTPTSSGKVSLEGGIYFLEKEESPQEWKIKKYKEHAQSSPKELDADKADEGFPKKGSVIKDDLMKPADQSSKDYGGFTNGKDDLKNMCSSAESSSCPSGSNVNTQSFKASGIWSPDDSKANKVSDGSSTSATSITQIYESGMSLGTSLDSFKGEWKNENIEPSPAK